MRKAIAVLVTGLLGTGCAFSDETAALQPSSGPSHPEFGNELWVTSQKNGSLHLFDDKGDADGTIGLAGAGPHITTFPASGKFAYVGGMLDGKVYVVDADTRSVVTSLQVGPVLAHQAKPSPDGSVLLVSVLSTRSVVKIAANESARTWSVVGSVSTEVFGKPPICTVYNATGTRAYVSLNPSGLAIIDVPTMTIVGSLPTDGFIACGMIKQRDGTIAIAASGSGGHIYSLDPATDTLTDRGTLGAPSWHSFITTDRGEVGFGSSPLSDEVVVIDLTTTPVTKITSIIFDTIPGAGNDQPDAFGGGERVDEDETLPVTLRAAGKLAFVNVSTFEVIGTRDVAAPSPFNPATCQDCAIHGVTARPDVR